MDIPQERTAVRRSRAILFVVSVMGLCLVVLAGAPPVSGRTVATEVTPRAPVSTPAITVTRTVSPVQGDCLYPFQALRAYPSNTPSSFTLRIAVTAPLCVPVHAVAVIYRMPNNGYVWPQGLVVRQEVPLAAAGVVDVTFARTCDAAQFDVVTGDTPSVIFPGGPAHGPLLFPFDTSTSYQDPGCNPPITQPPTTFPPFRPPPPPSPTTVVSGPFAGPPATVASATTVPGAPPAEVAPTSIVRPPTSRPQTPTTQTPTTQTPTTQPTTTLPTTTQPTTTTTPGPKPPGPKPPTTLPPSSVVEASLVTSTTSGSMQPFTLVTLILLVAGTALLGARPVLAERRPAPAPPAGPPADAEGGS